MPRTAIRPGDVTGSAKARLEKDNAAALQARAHEITLNAQVEAEARTEVVDLTAPSVVQVVETDEPVQVERAPKRIRLNSDLEQMTFGAGNHYDFEEGREYIVPADLADHLDALGYVWH